jgi:3,4-dihydroxy-2-butanone 4-phosphate synthase
MVEKHVDSLKINNDANPVPVACEIVDDEGDMRRVCRCNDLLTERRIMVVR